MSRWVTWKGRVGAVELDDDGAACFVPESAHAATATTRRSATKQRRTAVKGG
jgi:hypothetical protein